MKFFATDLFHPFKGGLAEIAGRQSSQAVEDGHVGHGAQVAIFFGGGAQAAPAEVAAVAAYRVGLGYFHRLVSP